LNKIKAGTITGWNECGKEYKLQFVAVNPKPLFSSRKGKTLTFTSCVAVYARPAQRHFVNDPNSDLIDLVTLDVSSMFWIRRSRTTVQFRRFVNDERRHKGEHHAVYKVNVGHLLVVFVGCCCLFSFVSSAQDLNSY